MNFDDMNFDAWSAMAASLAGSLVPPDSHRPGRLHTPLRDADESAKADCRRATKAQASRKRSGQGPGVTRPKKTPHSLQTAGTEQEITS